MSDPAHISVESLATPVAWLSAAGAVQNCNQAFASWLGVSVRRLQGMPLSELDVEVGRLSEVFQQHLHDIITRNSTENNDQLFVNKLNYLAVNTDK